MLSLKNVDDVEPTQANPVAASDALARQFLYILSRRSTEDDPDHLSADDLMDLTAGDDSASVGPTEGPQIHPDLAAAAILLARSLEATPGLMEELRRGTPLVTIATRADLVGPVASALRFCVLDVELLVSPKRYSARPEKHSRALSILRDGTERGHKPDKGNDFVRTAVLERKPIIGISPDPRRYLPRDLVRAADFSLTLGHLDDQAIALIIEAATGKAPTCTIPPALISAVDISDLCLAVRRQDTPDECIDRLGNIVRAKIVSHDSCPCLEELAGYGAAKEWGLNLAADLNAYKRGTLPWASIDRGLLLDGPPGVGKTQFAKALARSAGVPLVATSVAQWNSSSHLSGTLQAIRRNFDEAQQLAPSILFIDELDGISDRSRLTGDYVEYWSQIVNLLLELLSGIEDRPGIVVIAATNHCERIDPAVRRAGRLDRTITIRRPDVADLSEIFRFYLKIDLKDCSLMPLALAAWGSTGADVEAWVRRARSAARRSNRALTAEDVLHEIKGGRSYLTPHLRKVVCVHEAGHVVAAAALGHATPDIMWLTESGGRTISDVAIDNHSTLRGLENEITTSLSGRAAEKVVLGSDQVTVGAGSGEGSDLAIATQLAFDIEARYGLGECGLLRLPEATTAGRRHDRDIQAAINRRIDRCLQKAEALVHQHRAAVQSIANALDRNGHLDRIAIAELLQGHGLAPPS